MPNFFQLLHQSTYQFSIKFLRTETLCIKLIAFYAQDQLTHVEPHSYFQACSLHRSHRQRLIEGGLCLMYISNRGQTSNAAGFEQAASELPFSLPENKSANLQPGEH